jgi:autotransporter-associated beta strand protein
MKQNAHRSGSTSIGSNNSNKLRRKLMILSAATTAAAGVWFPLNAAVGATGPDTWAGNTSGQWNASNWTGTNNPPITGDSLVFGTAGSSGITLSDNLMTPATFSLGGITFASGASAFTINPATSGTNGFTLTGAITNSGTNTETINDLISLSSAGHTITLTTGGGNVTLGGAISGSGSITTAGAGTLTLSGTDTYTGNTVVANGTTLTFGTSGVLGSNSGSLTNVTLNTGGLTDVIDLAGTSQTFGLLTSGSTSNSAGIITSSAAAGVLTLNEAGTNANAYGGTEFTGSLKLVVVGNTTGNVQMTNASSSFTGGLTISSSSASSVGAASLNVSGGLNGQNSEGIRFNANSGSLTSPIGTGTITLDNGQLFAIGGASTIANNIVVTARGGIIHNENAGASYSGNLSSTANTELILNSNSGNSHGYTFSGSNSAFSGTFAIDTTNIGSVAFSGSALGNSNLNLLWYGDGTNGGLGVVESALASNGTLTFGELNNYSSGAIGSTFSGAIENTVSTVTTTIALGDSNSAAATFQGVIKNNSGTIALYKGGTNTQILSGTNTYTGTTTVSGGALEITGSLASGSSVTVNSGGTLLAQAGTNSGGIVAGPVTVNGGGAVGGTGTLSGVLTLATGTTSASQGAINLTSNSSGTFNVTNAAGLTLGGTAGNAAAIDLNASDRLAIAGTLTLNAGGASIYVTPGTAVANSSYTLLTFAGGAGSFATGTGTTVGALVLADPNLSFGVSGTLSVGSGTVMLITSGAAAPATAYWSGAQGTAWTAVNGSGTANFTSDLAGTTSVSALPGNTTNVFFAGTGAANLTTDVLGQTFDINSLTFLSTTGAVNIGGSSNALQIESGGITVSNTGAATISTGTLVLGSTQNWTNNTSTPLTVSSIVNGSGGLTITGPVNLGGASFASGSLTVNGALDVKGTSITTGNFSGSGSVTNTGSANAVLTTTVTGPQTFSGTLTDGGSGKTLSLFKAGSGLLALTGTNSYTGTTTVSGGTLQIGTGTSLGSGTVTIDNGTTLDLDGQTITNPLSLTGAGVSGAGALVNSSTLTTSAVNADMLLSPSFTVGGPGNITFQRVQNSNVFTLTDNSTGTLTLGTSGTTGHDNLLALVVNDGTALLNTPATYIDVDRGLTVNSGAYARITGTSTNPLSSGQAVTLNAGTLDLNNVNVTAGVLSGTGVLTNTAASSGTSTYTNAGNATATFSGAITDNAAASGGLIAYTQSGSLTSETFSGSNSYSGLTTVSNGTLISANNNAFGSSTATTAGLSLTGSTAVVAFTSSNPAIASLAGTASGASVVLGNVSTNSPTTLTIGGNNNNSSYAGSITDGSATAAGAIGSLVKLGSGTLTLGSSSTYSGGTLIKSGTVLATAGNALGTGTITLGDGSANNATLIGNPGSNVTNPNAIVVAAGTGTYTIKDISGHDYSFSGPVTLNSPVTLETTTNGASFYSGLITGSSTITIDGGGSTTKFVEFNNSGDSASFTGNLVIQDLGSFKTNTGGIGSLNTVYMDSGPTVFDNGVTNVTVAGFDDVTSGSSSADVIDAGTGYLITLGGSGSYSFSGAITSSGGVQKTGSGFQALNGFSTYSGATLVSNGTLDVTGAISGSGTINVATVNNPAQLILDGSNAVSSSAPINLTTTGTAVPVLTVNNSQTISSINSVGTTNFTAGNSGVGTFSGSGTLLVSAGAAVNANSALNQGAIVSAGSIAVNGGTANMVGNIDDPSSGQTSYLLVANGANLSATHIRQGVLDISAGSTVTIPSNPAGAYNPSSPAVSPTISVVNDLYNNGGSSSLTSGILDLKNNALIVNDPNEASSIIAAVYNAADFNPSSGSNQWDQPGITSSSAQANASSYALGSLTGTELTNLGSTAFQGLPVTSNSTVVAYTLIGDTQLRGTVDGTDYNNVLANYDTAGDWSQGNFYNESIVSGDDYNAVLNAYDVAAAGGAKGLKPAITRSLSPALSPVATSGTFHLEVNTTSGDVVIFNDSTSSAPLTLYNIVDGSQQDLLIGNPADANGTSGSIESGSPPYTNEHFLSVAQNDSNAVASITGRSSTNYKAWSLVLDGYNSNATALALSEGGVANKTDTINVPSYYSIDLGDIFNVGTTTVALTFQWGTETSAGGEGGTVYSNQPIDYIGTPEPASLGLLGLGGLAMMRRRRKA